MTKEEIKEIAEKEIEQYCREQDDAHLLNVRFTTLQAKIYDTIKAICNIRYLNELTDSQVIEARKIFQFIKDERAKQIF